MPYGHRDRFPSGITRAANVDISEKKKLKGFKQGRINVRKEVRRQQRLRNNLQRGVFRKLTSLLPKHIRTQAKIFSETGEFSRNQSYRQLENELFAVMRQHYRRVFITVFKDNESRYEKINKSIDVNIFGRNKDIEDLVNIYNNDRTLYLANMGRSVTNNVQKIITDGRANGASVRQIAKNINQTTPIAKRRAAAIARTETHNAVSFANHEYHDVVSKEYDIKMMKKWAATSDLRTRSAHSAVNGQIRPMDEPFDVGGTQMMHTGDPKGGAKNNINCRCVVVYVDADELDQAVDSTAPSRKPVNDFGEQHPDEIKPNKASFKGDENISIVNRRAQPLNDVVHIGKGAFFNHSGLINMGSRYKRSGESYNSVWLHEKGHAIDYDTKLLSMMVKYKGTKYLSDRHKNRLNAESKYARDIELNKIRDNAKVSSTYVNDGIGLSSFMAKQILDDRKLLRKRYNEGKKINDNFDINTMHKTLDLTRNNQNVWSTNLSKTQFVKKWKNELDKSQSVLKYDDLKLLYGDEFLEKFYDGASSLVRLNLIAPLSGFEDISNLLVYLKLNRLGDRQGNSMYHKFAKNNKFDNVTSVGNFSDLIGSITNNTVLGRKKGGYGHSNSYYAKFRSIHTGLTDAHATETFANFTSLLGSKESNVWRKLLAYHVPDSLKEYDKIMEHLARAEL